jgi:PAS domain S-box-containing protein
MVESIVESSTETVLNVAKAEAIRVLHVDDDPNFLKVAKQCLELQGSFHVDIAGSVEEALNKLKEKEYDAVVSDYQMSGKDGLEFLEMLRKNGNTIPFIMFTGRGREEVAVKAWSLGADHYVNKRGDPETTYCELAHCLRSTRERERDATERKEAEEKLRNWKEFNERVVDSIGDPLLIINPRDHAIISANEAALKQLKSRKEDLIGKTCFEATRHRSTPCAPPHGVCPIQELLKTGKPVTVEHQYVDEDNNRMFVEIVVHPVKDKEGKTVQVVHIAKDVTERKRVEEALRESEERLRSVFENSSDQIFMLDRDCRFLSINKTAADLSEMSPQEMIGRSISEIFPETIAAKFSGNIKTVFDTGKSLFLDETMVVKGRELYNSTSLNPVRDGNGRVTAVTGIVRDITERKKAEEEVRKNRRLLEETGKMAKVGGWELDLSTNEVSWTEEIGRIHGVELGYKPTLKEAIEFYAPESIPVLEATLKKTMETGEPYVLESLFIPRGSKDKIWVRSIGKAIYDGHKIVKLAGTFQDIDKYKKAEEALRQSEEGYRELAESIDDVFFAMDKDFRYTYWNKASEKLTGISAKDAVGKSLTEVFPDVKGTRVEQFYKEALRTQQPQSYLNKYQLEGKDYVFEINTYPTTTGLSVFVKDITERKKTEEMLRESEEKLRNVFAASPDAITVSDLNGNVVECNQATVALHGCASKEELIGKNSLEFIAKKDHKRAIENMKKTLEHGSTKNVEYTFVAKDGREFPAELSASVVTDASGKPEYYMAITTDLTKRKKAEETLRASEEKFRNLFENANDAMIYLDSSGRILDVNGKTVEIFGGTREELMGKQFTKIGLFSIEETRTFMRNFADVLTGKKTRLSVSIKNKKGQGIALECSVSLVKTGELTRLVVVARDLSERKKAEEELKSSEQKFRGLVEDSAAAIATIDLKGRLAYVNKALADSLGYSVQEMLGRAFKDFVHPDDRGNLVRLFLKIIVLRRRPRKFEFRALRKDGAVLYFTCRPTRLETAGKTRGFQAIITDNTAEKHMLEKAEKLNEKLSVVGGLTRHDVNNKLSTILNVSYLLKQKLRDTQCLELVKATESAVHQVEGLFEFARTYEKLGTEELAYVDAEKVFNEAARLFPSLQNIKTVNDCHGLIVFADSLLRQLFYNLVDNSLKHGEKVGQVRVHYQTDGDRVKLIYEDDGIGVQKAEKDKIFKEGYGKNSGHGLYLIKKMCEVYGWTIQETGKQGKGAQFTINMPKAKPDGRPNGKLG